MKKEGPDYRCVLCGILPRPTGPCRSETYKHYANHQYASEMRAQYGPVSPGSMVAYKECGKEISRSSWLAQRGQSWLWSPGRGLPPERILEEIFCSVYRNTFNTVALSCSFI